MNISPGKKKISLTPFGTCGQMSSIAMSGRGRSGDRNGEKFDILILS